MIAFPFCSNVFKWKNTFIVLYRNPERHTNLYCTFVGSQSSGSIMWLVQILTCEPSLVFKHRVVEGLTLYRPSFFYLCTSAWFQSWKQQSSWLKIKKKKVLLSVYFNKQVRHRLDIRRMHILRYPHSLFNVIFRITVWLILIPVVS